MEEEMSVDIVVPPPDREAIMDWNVMDLPAAYRQILVNETHGTSYVAIDDVLFDLLLQDRFDFFINNNNGSYIRILFDANLKIGLSLTYVFHQGKFLIH